MKRGREEEEEAAASCLMLLSKVGAGTDEEKPSTTIRRMFACKTCDKKFQTFQALGGHRASHKRARVAGDLSSFDKLSVISSLPKPKTHKCPICGLEFPIGQALGGHMRRHRSTTSGNNNYININNKKIKKLNRDYDHDDGEVVSEERTPATLTQLTPVMKKSSSFSKRVVCLDLNLTPLENDLVKLQMGQPVTATTILFSNASSRYSLM